MSRKVNSQEEFRRDPEETQKRKLHSGKILGIDTTTKFFSLGISSGDKVYTYNLELGRKHSSLLLPAIERVLAALGWEVSEIDYFACGLGPGSFTGVRLGLATIKGLAWGLNKPVLGIPSLDILARNAEITHPSFNAEVIPVIDAKRGLVYCARYKNTNGILKRSSADMLMSIGRLIKKMEPIRSPRAILLGDALGLYKDKILESIPRATLMDKDYWYPKAHNIIALAREKIKRKEFSNAFKVKPIYLYPKECQVRKV